jgi:hypothetical protein
LLQNADDNEYPNGVTPELKITLDREFCMFECNETGFDAGNVFAICYAAASSKKRKPNGRTFIGEKGIGFKSIFAVAQSVEIHSGDYHFELRDQEYVIPHILPGERQSGSRVVVRFKSKFPELPDEVSERLAVLTGESRHFLIFLQKLEKLIVHDRIQNVDNEVQVLRDPRTARCLVQSETSTIEYYVQSFPVEVPLEIVKSRFEELNDPLQREILFAIPLPGDLNEEEDLNGGLFCYLPTRQNTGMPIHIQLDAKTVTNREDIADRRNTPWNGFMLEKTTEGLVWLFNNLKNQKEFSPSLPLYLPPDPENLDISNRDFKQAVESFCGKMYSTEWVLDGHSDVRPPNTVRTCPTFLERFILTSQYEQHLPSGMGVISEDTDSTFLNTEWTKYREILKNYGVRELSSYELAQLWKIAGVPDQVRNGEELIQRDFLRAVMREQNPHLWKECPIFPLRNSRGSEWGGVGANVILLITDTQNPTIPEGATIVDPVFTISPSGSSKQSDEIRNFNASFRDFLLGRLLVAKKTDTTFFEEVIIKRMQVPRLIPDRSSLLKVSEEWIVLYYRIWRREKTIQDESQRQWDNLLKEIRKCHVPVTFGGAAGGKTTAEVSETMLPVSLGGEVGLEEAYREANVPVIDLLISDATDAYWKTQARKRESEIDLTDWRRFLLAVGAGSGPRVLSCDLNSSSLRSHSAPPGSEFFENDLCELIPGSSAQGFTFSSIKTIQFDKATAAALYRKDIPEALTQALVGVWPQVTESKSSISYRFGASTLANTMTTPLTLASSQLRGRPLKVLTRDGSETRAEDCFLDIPENVLLAEGILPLVDGRRYQANYDFLKTIGVKGSINPENLERCIREAFEIRRIPHDTNHFEPYLQLVAKLAARNKSDKIRFLASPIFLDPLEDELLNFKEWKNRGCDLEFNDATRESLNSAFGDGTAASSPEDLIALLESFHDLGTSPDFLAHWFLQVAIGLHNESGARVVGLFAELVSTGKLICMGEPVSQMNDLPLIWDLHPFPDSLAGIILPPDRPDEESAFLHVASRLGWPTASSKVISVQPGKSVSVEPKIWRLIDRILNDLQVSFRKTNASGAMRIANLPFARGVETLKNSLVPVYDVALIVKDLDVVFSVPFWKTGGAFLISAPSGDIVSAIGPIIDQECNITVTPFIEMIQTKVESEIMELSDPVSETENFPPGGTSVGGRNLKVGSQTAEDLLLGFEDDERGADSKSGNQLVGSKGEVRKRLCSYVSFSSGSGKKPAIDDGTSNTVDENSKTEQKGAEILRAFIKDNFQADLVSVEDENCGYDFELKIGLRTLCIELKASRAKWRGWEHGLTPNEFKTALEKQENYFLCVVDRVFESSREICFIQNPAAKITDFLFDSPWKSMQSRMIDLISSIKAIEGILDE